MQAENDAQVSGRMGARRSAASSKRPPAQSLPSLRGSEALAKIDEVDEAWWMRLPPEVGRLVTVDVDYR